VSAGHLVDIRPLLWSRIDAVVAYKIPYHIWSGGIHIL